MGNLLSLSLSLSRSLIYAIRQVGTQTKLYYEFFSLALSSPLSLSLLSGNDLYIIIIILFRFFTSRFVYSTFARIFMRPFHQFKTISNFIWKFLKQPISLELVKQ